MQKRILYVITDSGIGGTERVLLHLLSSLDSSVAKPVGVIVLKGKREMGEKWEGLGIPVHYLNQSSGLSVMGPGLVYKLIKQIHPDVVHALLFHSVQTVRIAKWFGFSASIVTSPRVNYRFAPILARLIDSWMKTREEKVLCESTATQNYLHRHLGYQLNQLVVIHNGVDKNTFQKNEEYRKKWRKEWNIDEGEIVIGSVGRLHHQKGFDILMEAAVYLKELNKKFRIVIVGEGPEENKLKHEAETLQIDVVFMGNQDNVEHIYPAFDIYTQPSRYEGLPNALLEAFASGLPCVATGVDGILDLVKDGENGLLIKPHNAHALAAGLGLLIEKEELRNKIAMAASATAEQWSLENMVKGFQNTYLSVFDREK